MIIPNHEEIARFVTESNAIENTFVSQDHPLFIDHVRAVEFAITSVMAFPRIPAEPRLIHGVLLASQPEKMPGQYRSVKVVIGGNKAPEPHLVPCLMTDLSLRVLDNKPPPGADMEQRLWNAHYEFECIHPFIDGNGRVGRIWMNELRLLYGLPWITVCAAEKYVYYQKIQRFRLTHPFYRQYRGA